MPKRYVLQMALVYMILFPLSYGTVGNITHLNQPFSLNELEYVINHTKVTTLGEDKVSAKLFKGLNLHARISLLQIDKI